VSCATNAYYSHVHATLLPITQTSRREAFRVINISASRKTGRPVSSLTMPFSGLALGWVPRRL